MPDMKNYDAATYSEDQTYAAATYPLDQGYMRNTWAICDQITSMAWSKVLPSGNDF